MVSTVKDCQAYCVKHKNCTGFAISEFERICELYNITPGANYIPQSGSRIYVRERDESEGLHRFHDIYLKLVVGKLSKYKDAEKYCKSLSGQMAPVTSEEMNKVMVDIMGDHKVWRAFIGLTDEELEQEWRYPDGNAASYNNWAYDGTWYRRDRNCAILTLEEEGLWRDENCNTPSYFFCSISVY
ncbi:UNVERIFIED_CONTAM: hypothetical protein RMT77_010845 [Armadillidium vulgare]